jgi:hypothetical protein
MYLQSVASLPYRGIRVPAEKRGHRYHSAQQKKLHHGKMNRWAVPVMLLSLAVSGCATLPKRAEQPPVCPPPVQAEDSTQTAPRFQETLASELSMLVQTTVREADKPLVLLLTDSSEPLPAEQLRGEERKIFSPVVFRRLNVNDLQNMVHPMVSMFLGDIDHEPKLPAVYLFQNREGKVQFSELDQKFALDPASLRITLHNRFNELKELRGTEMLKALVSHIQERKSPVTLALYCDGSQNTMVPLEMAAGLHPDEGGRFQVNASDPANQPFLDWLGYRGQAPLLVGLEYNPKSGKIESWGKQYEPTVIMLDVYEKPQDSSKIINLPVPKL